MSDGAMETLWFDKLKVTSFQTVYIWIYIAAVFFLFGVVCIFCWSFLALYFLVCCRVNIVVRVIIYSFYQNYVFSPKCM